MNTNAIIRNFARRASGFLSGIGFLRGVIRSAPFFFASFLVLAALERGVEIPVWGVRLLWLIVVGGGIGLLVSGFYPFSIFSLEKMAFNLHRRVQSLRSDELRLAVELSAAAEKAEAPSELRDVYLRDVVEKISACRTWWCFPRWNWKRPVIAAAVVFVLGGSLQKIWPAIFSVSPAVLFPFSSINLERSISIEPGDARVPMGLDAAIILTLKEKSMKDPVLEVKASDGWQALQPDASNLGRYSYTVKKVTQPLMYRVVWKKESSRKFTLTPVLAAQFTNFSLLIHAPDYLKKEPQRQTLPEITGLAGSQIDLEAEANAPLTQASLTLSDGRELHAISVKEKKAAFHFAIDKTGTYSFTLTPENGVSAKQAETYPIHVTEDQPPTVTLLSPDQDVVVGQKEKLPIVFDARDDYGLSEATLVWETSAKTGNRMRVKKFEASVENTITTYEWDLAAQSFQPGEVVRFRIEVLDNNTLTGPGKAVSAWRIVEIKSFEVEHAVIQKALEVWRAKALETLAQVTTLKEKTSAEKADLDTLSKSFAQPEQNLQTLEAGLKQIVSKMENDPLADYGVWLEHKEMQQNLSQLNQGALRETRAAFQTQNKPSVNAHLDQIANELERMSALSEDLTKSQNARDVTQAGENLENIGDKMKSALESGEKSEAMKKINDLVAEAEKNLMEMARALQQMPQDLPEDFVNQEALKNLEIGKSQDILGQISEAMKSGDMKKAMALAQKFSEMAKNMRKQLDKAHDSFLKSNSAESIGKEIAEQQQALDKLTEQQRAVLAETQKLASKRLEAVMKAQEDLLAELAVRQEKVVQATNALVGTKNLAPTMGILFASQIRPMELVAGEFRSKHLDKSPEVLTGIVRELTAINTELARSSSTAVESAGRIVDEEASILAAIKNPPSPKQSLSTEDQERYSDLEKRQRDLRGDAQGIKEKLQTISRKTATLGPGLMHSLSEAGNDMKDAADSLGQHESPSAQRSEEKALDNLLSSQSALSEAQAAMGEMSAEQGGEGGGSNPGSGSGGPNVILRNSGGGSRGNQTGKVKLPTADDYRPPKAFREDIMESLKENYPQIYEEIIQKYYKRLSE